jgi:FkbM family methyltransferase
MSKLKYRLHPLIEKLSGRATLCPWSSVLALLHPQTFKVHPPKSAIEVVEISGRRKLLQFGGKHRFWFPVGMTESAELWSEYLVGFWDHPLNFHQYVRGGVTLGAGDVVVDCGACEGFFTRAALEAGARLVVSVEPSAMMADCLRATFEKEIAECRVVVAQVALGSFSGKAGFTSEDDDAFAGRFDGGSELVEVTTLAKLATEHGMPTFIKMDLEGSEYQALCGGIELLQESKPKLGITTYHNPWDHAVLSSLLKGLGYRTGSPYGVTVRGGTTPRPVMIHAW